MEGEKERERNKKGKRTHKGLHIFMIDQILHRYGKQATAES